MEFVVNPLQIGVLFHMIRGSILFISFLISNLTTMKILPLLLSSLVLLFIFSTFSLAETPHKLKKIQAISEVKTLPSESESISSLKKIINTQNSIINDLKYKLALKKDLDAKRNNNTMTFEVWAGILLAVSALVLGAVGIGLAVFSFIGYKELINKGVERATSVASEVSEKVAKETILEKVKKEVSEQISELIIDGTFDNVITERVQNYIYRGVNIDANSASTNDTNNPNE